MLGDTRAYAAMATPVTSAQVVKAWVRPNRRFAAVSWSRRREALNLPRRLEPLCIPYIAKCCRDRNPGRLGRGFDCRASPAPNSWPAPPADEPPKVRFAIDSSLEGDGFEPSVPRGKGGLPFC